EMIEYGAALHHARMNYVERLNQVLAENDYGRAIFAAERVNVRYRSQLEGKGNLDNFMELFRERLGARLQAELAAGHALIGAHRGVDFEPRRTRANLRQHVAPGDSQSLP